MYDLTQSVYTRMKEPVKVRCKVHGEFTKRADRLLAGAGCKKCTNQKISERYRCTQDEFISKASAVHNNKYFYNNVKYISSLDKVIITCPIHGDFEQLPKIHVRGNGCPKCGIAAIQLKTTTNPVGWSYSQWEQAGYKSNVFSGFNLYVLRCSNTKTDEQFIKIGKTFKTIEKRFAGKTAMPYTYEVVLQLYGDARHISRLEDALKKELKPYAYTPTIPFHGRYECYTVDIIDLVTNTISSKTNETLAK